MKTSLHTWIPTWIHKHLKAFCHNEDGVTAIEYGVIIALFSGTLLVALPNIGDGISNPLTQLTSAINNGGGASSGDDDEGDDDSDDHSDDDDESDDDDDYASDDHESDDDNDHSDDDSDDDSEDS
ncbi:MAG: hypothetical protein COB46_09045 [Rhodospirillaceae bacterium]|nr:MAG: hypothetical protein COB46_09045 [Rhodospirillaceae bacterium]